MEDRHNINRQYNEWLKTKPLENINCLTEENLKQIILDDIDFIKGMSHAEYLLYKKWVALQIKYPSREIPTLFGKKRVLDDAQFAQDLKVIKHNIWIPDQPDDYLKLKPVLEYTGDGGRSEIQSTLSLFVSSGERGHSNIGRNMHFIAKDDVTGKYLGTISISSDYLDMRARDQYIGWERESKTTEMIKHTAVCSIIVPTQPLGFSYVGGKLLSLLCLTDDIRDKWEEVYGQKLVGLTTTSFYGKSKEHGLSQYDNLKHWKKLGFTTGSVSFEPTKPVINLMMDWMKKNYPRQWFELYMAKRDNGQPVKHDHRNRSFNFVYGKLGIPKKLVESKHERGIYFSEFYTNTNEFLRKEISENELQKSFDSSNDYMVELWRNKYASKRVASLLKNDRFSYDGLFYDDLLYMSWEETKAKYLGDMGR